jgi:hypothetical protein
VRIPSTGREGCNCIAWVIRAIAVTNLVATYEAVVGADAR